MWSFIGGVMIGGTFGIFLMCLLQMNRRKEEDE